MNKEYKEKYLKYKIKYLDKSLNNESQNTKNLKGGSDSVGINKPAVLFLYDGGGGPGNNGNLSSKSSPKPQAKVVAVDKPDPSRQPNPSIQPDPLDDDDSAASPTEKKLEQLWEDFKDPSKNDYKALEEEILLIIVWELLHLQLYLRIHQCKNT